MKDILTDLYMCCNHTLRCYNLTGIYTTYLRMTTASFRDYTLRMANQVYIYIYIYIYICYTVWHIFKIIPHFLNNSLEQEAERTDTHKTQTSSLSLTEYWCRVIWEETG